MAYYGNILEEELKNKVAHDLFADFDTTQIIGRIDFCVSLPTDPLGISEPESLLWAEAKKGTKHDIIESFIQLILTIGRERPQDNILPPTFIGAFDAEKIAFLPYNAILGVLRQNDFNWKVAPSNHQTKEFLQLQSLLTDALNHDLLIYHYEQDARELARFIRANFYNRKLGVQHIRINKNNFTHIYQKWLEAVKPTINVNWEMAKKAGIIEADFYLADILSEDNKTLGEKLFVLLQNDHYLLDRRINDFGLENYTKVSFTDNQRAHTQFWNRYSRPPRPEYHAFMVGRRDLLVPQDIRERKGSFFTPQRWVELSQQYIAAELGENWQEEYYIWDCCAGTGNLLAGLTNKYNIYASTLDQADVQVMLQRIEAMNEGIGTRASLPADNSLADATGVRASLPAGVEQFNSRGLGSPRSYQGANLLESHVFQFDFLNDPLLDEVDKDGNITKKSKLPRSLQDIIRDPEKRKKLVIYINPPYAEAGNRKVIADGGTVHKQKKDVAVRHLTYKKYLDRIGIAGRELFAQFIIRIYDEIPTAVLAQFSKLKIVQAPNFSDFRKVFRAKSGRAFCVPANTFDNVKGNFPIGFFIWHTDKKEVFEKGSIDVYDHQGAFIGKKGLYALDGERSINDWMIETRQRANSFNIGYMSCRSHDVSNVNYNFIMNDKSQMKSPRGTWVTNNNIIETAIYIAVCHCIEATWLNDRDQFLYPNDGWQSDTEFQTDCLVFTLFHGQNRISGLGVRASQPADSTQRDARGLGSPRSFVNHWIPFTEEEVGAQEKFESHFMSDFLRGKMSYTVAATEQEGDLFAGVRSSQSADSTQRDTREQGSPRSYGTSSDFRGLGSPRSFSDEAQAVMEAGRELWRYYHQQPIARTQPNASFYDIRLYFQGTKTTKSGKQQMNTSSTDERYTDLIADLRQKMKLLAKKIEPKVYEYGFLK